MKKKIGVVTYWNIYNYGSFFQAFALQKVLENMGFQPCIVTINKKLSIRARIVKKVKLIVRLIRWPQYLGMFLELRNTGKSSVNNISNSIRKKFAQSQQNINVIYVTEKELVKRAHSDEFYVFICGSDQIWNLLGFEVRNTKFLSFAPEYKRIAYAPSFGIDYIPEYNIKAIKKALKHIPALSIREESGQKIIRDLIGTEVPVVLDPTLLMDRRFYEQYECAVPKLATDYILCYFLSQPDDTVLEYIKDVSDKNQKKIVYLPYPDTFSKNLGVEFCAASPYEFLTLFHNASAVFTDSFHGTLFSIIYQKPFTVFERKQNEKFKQITRISSILNKLGLSERIYSQKKAAPAPFECDYINVELKLLKEKEASMAYLKTVLLKRNDE